MWNRLTIRTQLTLLIGAVLGIVAIALLGAIQHFDNRERQNIAIDQAETLARSLNNDLLQAIVAADTDTYANINFRISGYSSVEALTLFDDGGREILHYGKQDICQRSDLAAAEITNLFLPSGLLCYHAPVTAEAHHFGESVIVVNLKKFETQRRQHLITVLSVFSLALLLGLLLSWAVSRGYTLPFKVLASAMQEADLGSSRYGRVETDARNEIGLLFDGYNQMLDKIRTSAEELSYRSKHDSLTDLYNRYAADTALQAALKDKTAASHVLLSLDIDDFKLVNDSMGHLAGDHLLQLIAQRCSAILPDNAMMARVGGDEFYILLRKMDKDSGIAVAETYQDLLRKFSFSWEGNAIAVSATISMVAFAPFQFTLEELIKVSDLAFHAAKSTGRNKLHVYSPEGEQTKRLGEEVQIAGFLKEALHSGPARFELHAQEIAPLQEENDAISYEVLIRMLDSNGSFLRPDRFLPTAERYQLMAEIDAWVLWTYLETVTAHPEHVQTLASVHINLAGASLNSSDFQKRLKQAFDTFDFPWHKLELEITETSAVGNFGQARRFIDDCRSRGIGFALDDFGTGMASFDYLKNFPFDIVKIDGSFVRNLHNDPVDQAMVRYTYEICRLKNQKTIAEYVETRENLETLRQIGIDYGQGYFIGKPCPLREWMEL